MFTDINYKLADALVRNIAYYTVIKDASQARVDLICSIQNGEAAFSAVCDVHSGWIYAAASRRRDQEAMKISPLVKNIDPWKIYETREHSVPESFELLSLEQETIEPAHGAARRPSRSFIDETQQNMTEQLYNMLGTVDHLKGTNRRHIAMHVRKGEDVSSLKFTPRKPVKQMLQSVALLSTTIYDPIY